MSTTITTSATKLVAAAALSSSSRPGSGQTTRRPSFDTSTPCLNLAVNSIKYKDIRDREKNTIAPESSISKPNYEDILKRVSIVIHQHITKCEARMSNESSSTTTTKATTMDGTATGILFHGNQMAKFIEENFLRPEYSYQFVREPLLKTGVLFALKKIVREFERPSLATVHEFLVCVFSAIR